MSEKFEETRRETLKRFSQWFVTGVALWSSKNLGDAVWAEVEPYARQSIHEKVVDQLGPLDNVRDLFAELFLGTREKVYLVPAQDNPAMTPDPAVLKVDPYEVFTRTTLDAAKAFGAVLDIVEERIRRIDQLIALNGHGNLITFGSPTSNLIARAAMRYGPTADGSDGLEYWGDRGLELTIRYELNGERIRRSDAPHRVVTRVVQGREHAIPNWGIVRGPGGVECPELRGDKLTQDYLLISSLPNVFHRGSLDAGHRIVNFGGTHREGTAATTRLFTNQNILESLRERIRSAQGSAPTPPYWQALLSVDCEVSGGSIAVLDFRTVESDDRELRRMADANMSDIRRGAKGAPG